MLIWPAALAAGIVLFIYIRNPFPGYPYFIKRFDVSGRRKPDINDYLDRLLMDDGFYRMEEHHDRIVRWKQDCEDRTGRSLFKNRRRRQYRHMIDDDNAFVFIFVRQQTRYRQSNYVKTAYKVNAEDSRYACSFKHIENRYRQLEEIGFSCTLNEYHCRDQRKLATRELRVKIMKRDNYTCRQCGKYMPDEVGLQIDHIVPVSKGGRTIESNLQVLCSKCNGAKSNKT